MHSEFRKAEHRHSSQRKEVDIGYLTYERECERLKVKPRRAVTSQLWGDKLTLAHCDLLTNEVKAVCMALMVSSLRRSRLFLWL